MASLVLGMFLCTMIANWGGLVISMVFMLVYVMCSMNVVFSWGTSDFVSYNSTSFLLVFLSVLLCFLSIICTPNNKETKYLYCVSSLSLVLSLFFLCNNILSLYIMFEVSLIPTLLLIIGWGYQPERLQAGTYMVVYTVAASLPFLLILVWRGLQEGTYDMQIMKMLCFTPSELLSFFCLLAFLVKLPMYGFHLWLPKAHVEAPLAGSMILAGVLLKMGGYGLIQVTSCFNIVNNWIVCFLVSLSMWGGLLASFMCLRQVDLKAFVAYSSVSHMGLVIAGVLLDRSFGLGSAMVTMMAHGFCSSALFCLCYFTYSKINSRIIMYLGGMLVLYPSLAFMWFSLCCINMAAPPSMNLVGELMVVPALWSGHLSLVIVMGLLVFFSAAYNMYLYCSVNHGISSTYLCMSHPMSSMELISVMSHVLPYLLLFKLYMFF
uniref:NADH-ubiquinone oxidoreductase chain 4 n=1 Tax=Pedipes pedipes TaxID=999235 RepID=G8HPC0_9EUPU|nr:NADH dehydrogenase subunit 4 [Pedipes pedipes]AEQ93861.1 NADH dehydrogenase subunit 4 [Pedipes pedipes]